MANANASGESSGPACRHRRTRAVKASWAMSSAMPRQPVRAIAYAINLGASAVTTASRSTPVMNPTGPFGNTRLVNSLSLLSVSDPSGLSLVWRRDIRVRWNATCHLTMR
jgi:hypothetical protein